MHQKLTRDVLTESVVNRIEKYIRPAAADECWNWTSTVTPGGYGKLTLGVGSVAYAHRLAFMLAYDFDIPAGMVIMHSCDNPKCCNPSHLRLGTFSENSRDREAKGRGNRDLNPKRASRWEPHLNVIIEAYNGGESVHAIGARYKVSGATIWKLLKDNGVPIRGRWGQKT